MKTKAAVVQELEDAFHNSIDMVSPLPGSVMIVDPHARWFVEVLWYSEKDECWVRSWAHHKRVAFVGDRGFRSLEGAFHWAQKELPGFLFSQGPGIPSCRVRFYWSDTGPATDTWAILKRYSLGGDVV